MSQAVREDGRLARGAATRGRLVDAAFDAVAEGGLDGLTTRAVAERAGVSHAMCHYHFAGRQDLVLALVGRARRYWIEPMDALAGADVSARERLERVVAWMAEPATSEVMRVHMELCAQAEWDEALHARMAAEYEHWQRAYVRLFADLGREGALVPGTDVEALGRGFAIAADGLVTMRSLDSSLETERIMWALLRPHLVAAASPPGVAQSPAASV